MNTIRELIIQEILARAATLRIALSPVIYNTDCGDNVFRARLKVDPDELPCIVLWPQTEEAENKHGQALHRMPLRIEGIALFGADNPSVVSERILGDLIRCFTSPTWDRRRLVVSPASPVTYLAPYAESIVYQGGGTDSYPEEGSMTIGAYVKLLITYWTAMGDPYTQ